VPQIFYQRTQPSFNALLLTTYRQHNLPATIWQTSSGISMTLKTFSLGMETVSLVMENYSLVKETVSMVKEMVPLVMEMPAGMKI
jgi:hypothetical protein